MIYKFVSFLLSLFFVASVSAQKANNYQKDKFDILFYDAVNARATQDYGSSLDLLQYCFAMDSTNTAVAYELGNFYKTLNQNEKALALYQKAANGLPENYYYGVTYAVMALQSGELDGAISTFTRLIKDHPSYSNLYFYLAEAYKQNKDYQKAIDALTTAEEFVGLNEQVSLAKYDLYKLLDEEDKAFAEIQKYIDRNPEESDYYVLMGDLYMQDEKPEKAKPYYEKAKVLDPSNPYIVVSLASYYEKVGQKNLADEEMRQAILNASMDIETKMQILAQYASDLHSGVRNDSITANDSIENNKKINSLFDTLMVIHPQEPRLNMLYGNVLMLQGEKNFAIDQFNIFAEANPSNPMGWEQIVSVAFPDSLDLVISTCDKAIKNLPPNPQFYYYKGVASFLKKDYTNAIEAFETGKTYIPENNLPLLSDFYGQIGDIYHEMGKMDSTYISYDKALKYNPNNILVLNNYSYFLSLEKKDLPRAERMSSITIKADPLNPTYLDTYAWVLFQQGDYTLARMYLEKAIDNIESGTSPLERTISSEMYDHYGDILYKLGEKEEALENWKKAKEALIKEKGENNLLDKKIETGEYQESEE